MAWWDSRHRNLGASPPPKNALAMGDVFPKLGLRQQSTTPTMDRERALLSPISGEHQLAVHVNIQFTDPVIRSSYHRSYSCSPGFEPSNRICSGLLRRIEHSSKELLTRKDSGALEILKDGSYERKPLRFEMTFRLVRRGWGEWAERTFRSYQEQPLTVALTKDIILASHRMVGLFLRRHDKDFQWLDGTVCDTNPPGRETMLPPLGGPVSLLCVPRSKFVESSQTFEFAPGYSIELSFRSRNPRRKVAAFGRVVRVNSNQTAPLTLLMSEDLLWKGLRATNRLLELRKHDFDGHIEDCRTPGCQHFGNEALDIELRVSNNLGPLYSHVRRNIQSQLSLFHDPEARDCHDFLRAVEDRLMEIKEESDARISEMNDLEFCILELKGVGWAIQQPAKFILDSSASYGRRTIQAALDRIQTGLGDVIRGHNVAVHFTAHKRSHLILDKAIVAHQKRGAPVEVFASPDEEKAAFVSRLKKRIQEDIDMVFKDTCCIDDIPEDEDDQASVTSSINISNVVIERQEDTTQEVSLAQLSPKGSSEQLQQPSRPPMIQRRFSLSCRPSSASTQSVESAERTNDSTSAPDATENDSNSSSSLSSTHDPAKVNEEDSIRFVVTAPDKPAQRCFPLVPKRFSPVTRVSNASTLVEEISGVLEAAGTVDLEQEKSVSTGDSQRETDEIATILEENLSRESHSEAALMTSRVVGSDASNNSTAMPLDDTPTVHPSDSTYDTTEQVPVAPRDESCDGQERETEGHVEDEEEESTTDPNIEHVRTCKTPSLFEGLKSHGAEEYPTTPSTPALSSGGDSSPRNSILMTPVYLRTLSGTRDPVVRDFEPESEPDAPGLRIEAEMGGELASKRREDSHPLADMYPTGSAFLSPSPEIVASELTFDGSDNLSIRVSDPEAAYRETPPLMSHPSSPPLEPESPPIQHFGMSENLSDGRVPVLGAEPAVVSDECCLLRSDFPTPEVRRSDPTQEPGVDLPPRSETSSAPKGGTEASGLSGCGLEKIELVAEEEEALHGVLEGPEIPSEDGIEYTHGTDQDSGAADLESADSSVHTLPDASPEDVERAVIGETGNISATPSIESGPGLGAEVISKVSDSVLPDRDSISGGLEGADVGPVDEPLWLCQDADAHETENFLEDEPEREQHGAGGHEAKTVTDTEAADVACEIKVPSPEAVDGQDVGATETPDGWRVTGGAGLETETMEPVVCIEILQSQDDPTGDVTGALSVVQAPEAPKVELAIVELAIKGESGVETESLFLEAANDQRDVAPEISVEDPSAPPLHSELPLADKGTVSGIFVAGSTEPPVPEPPEPSREETVVLLSDTHHPGGFNPFFLSPLTAAPSARSSMYSISDLADAQSLCPSSRGSVEDVRRSSEDIRRPVSSEQHHRPQTAGYLGLGETRRIKIGLQGMRGDLRRFGLPLQYMLDRDDGPVEKPRPSTSGGGRHRKLKKLPATLGSTKKPSAPVEEAVDDDQVLPRVMFLLAGVAVISKVFKGSAN
ncbi:hypothetical protein B0T17DRAFT_509787 [Bombardia bombarda]|uniref:Pt repeat family protein n=1 Tax=Bombardia bombarda TaxID=252184 RepID=A0AA39WMP0_9PEZI|nr:hypothetical protein B0T17DRAFT_509787 [Bombardia bombarda]